MRHSFEEIVKILKDNHIMTQGQCDTDTFVVIPIKKTALAIEQWRTSNQQPEDEVVEELIGTLKRIREACNVGHAHPEMTAIEIIAHEQIKNQGC